MDSQGLRSREKGTVVTPSANAGVLSTEPQPHPIGPVKHGSLVQGSRMLGFFTYFTVSIIVIHIAQSLAAPLYFVNKNLYYDCMAVTKEFFGLVITTITQWFSPITVRVSGDDDVAAQIVQTKEGRLECRFPDRLVMIANHQIYTDWLYLWWIGYTNRMHGHIYIILKKSLKYIPIVGPGMILFNFIFLARNWTKDKPTFEAHLKTLKISHSPTRALDRMWLLIFPEGTNLSFNGRTASAKWASKTGIPDMQHQLLPRSTGLEFCLKELRGTVDWIYDCTIAYEGVPRGSFGQDVYSLRSTYFQGRAPPSVNMYWRRFAVADIPMEDHKVFDDWLLERWREKDVLLEKFMQDGRFPASSTGGRKYIETSVRQRNPLEFLLIFAPALVFALIGGLIYSYSALCSSHKGGGLAMCWGSDIGARSLLRENWSKVAGFDPR